jgi:RNA polymerase sigma factor (sigma-70 family)
VKRVQAEPGQVDDPVGRGDLARIAYDPDVFEAFYRSHVEAVERFVARRVDDPYLAADLTADVFLAAIDSVDKYRPGRGAPVAWLFGVARNVVAAEHRRGERERRATDRIAASTDLVDADDLARLHGRIDAEADARRIYRAIERLAAGERAVLELVALDGLGVSEAARALGIRTTAARVRLHRARRQVKRELGTTGVDGKPRLSEA